MDGIRTLIQSSLSSLTDVECGVPIPDGMVEEGQTYFGYEMMETYRGSDLDKRYIMQVDLTGRLVRKEDPTENTLQIMDLALEDIKEALKGLNLKYSYNDISFQDGIRKILVKASGRYYEENNEFIV